MVNIYTLYNIVSILRNEQHAMKSEMLDISNPDE
jgi:hypothetical protein